MTIAETRAHSHRGHKQVFQASFAGNLVASRYDADPAFADAPPVLLLHGGGQTRHAWQASAAKLAGAGFTAFALDQRGHGDSNWPQDGAYRFTDFAADALAVARQIGQGGKPPFVVGASLGGLAALLALGQQGDAFSGLALVDVTPQMNRGGVDHVRNFMRANATEGFASLEEAANAVAAYLPHRPKPSSLEGLKKNLRRREDGRYYWHWDPRFFEGPHPVDQNAEETQRLLIEAAAKIAVPALLVRGRESELVGQTQAEQFRQLCPHAEYVDIAGARHMVAGDRNDIFAKSILDFLKRRFLS